MGDKDYRPEEVSAMILSKLKADAEEKTGEKLPRQLLLSRHTLTMHSVRQPKMQERLLDWM